MEFQVKVFDAASSQVRDEVVDAVSPSEAEARLTTTDLVVLSVKRSASKVSTQSKRELDVAWWCRELRTLIAAGMTVVEALETLQAEGKGRTRLEIQSRLLSELRQGKSLSEALRAQGVFPAMLVASVRASERTSGLVQALDDYIRFDDMLTRMRSRAVSAAIYPALVVGLGLLIALFLLMFVLPRFSQMYVGLSGPLSTATIWVIGLSHWLNAYREVAAMLLAFVLVLGWLAWQKGLLARLGHVLMNAIGPLKRQLDEFRLATFYQSLALMFRGGYSLDDALAQCSGLSMGPRFQAGIDACRNGLQSGQRVSVALQAAGLTDTVSQRLLAVGERTGSFDHILQTIAERHAHNFSVFVERMSRLIEPILLALVSVMVGGIVVLMYMPVFDLANSVR